jgi:hypothetical protein
MDSAASMGSAVSLATTTLFVLAATLVSLPAAAENYALVVSGASAGEPYAAKYSTWRQSFVSTLRTKFGYPDDHVIVLAEDASSGVRKATLEGVRKAILDLRSRLTADDQLVVLLIGHGTIADGPRGPLGDDARFNLVGPDLKASEWGDLLKPLAARVIFVDTTAASFPFLRHLSAPGRIVITATDSTAQEFETVFGEFFVRAFEDPVADADKNGRVSVFEAFTYAGAAARNWYEQRGQLPTERPMIDGDQLARTIFLQPTALPSDAGSAIARRQHELEAQIENLKRNRASMPPAAYDAELERLLIEVARVSRP